MTDKIGPFQIVEIIHRGPQPLFRARAKDGHEVALKAVPVANLTAETRERFTREAQTCRGLEHPNLIRVFEMGEADGMLFQAMEMLEGADLGKVNSRADLNRPRAAAGLDQSDCALGGVDRLDLAGDLRGIGDHDPRLGALGRTGDDHAIRDPLHFWLR